VIASMGSKSTHWQAILPFLLVNFFNLALSFNIDTKSLVVQQGPKASCDDCMFGFSVAQHKEGGVPWLLIGAPEADARQPGVHKGGAVYKCSAEVPGDCTIIPFDTKGSTPTPTGQPYDSKSGQWLGSVVTSSGEDGTVLACAPRYIYYVYMNRRDPVGVCHIASKNFTEFRKFRPCVESGNFTSKSLICCVGRPAHRDTSGFQEI